MSRGPRPWELAVYRAVLRLYPRRLRREHGPEMLEAFADRFEDGRYATRWRRLRVWRDIVRDLVASLARERFGAWQGLAARRGGPPQRPASPGAGSPAHGRGGRSGAGRGTGGGALPGPPSMNGGWRPVLPSLGALVADLRHGARVLLRAPGTTLALVATLALGIGVNVAVFSLIDDLVLRPFPYVDATRVVHVDWGWPVRFSGSMDHRAFGVVARHGRVLEDVAAFREQRMGIVAGGEPRTVAGLEASASLFRLLGVAPRLGRTFTDREEGPDGEPVVVLGHRLWTDRFGADEGVLGETIRVDGVDRIVIGVMPEAFAFYESAELWVPLSVDATTAAGEGEHLSLVARLRDGVSRAEATTALRVLEPQLRDFVHEGLVRENAGVALITLEEAWNPRGFGLFGGLFQAVAVSMLLVVCANVAGLLLAQGLRRRPEMALRRVLGGGRLRLVRQLLTESTLLAVAGCLPALAVAAVAFEALVGLFAASPFVLRAHLGLDARIVGVTLGLAALAVVGIGTAPALELSRTDLGQAMKDRGIGTTAGPRTRRWHRNLTVAQLVVALVLLAGTVLVFRSIAALQRIEPGYDAARTLQVHVPPTGERSSDELYDFARRAMERVEGLPGVASVAWWNGIQEELLGDHGALIELETGPGRLRNSNVRKSVSHGYFATLGIPILRGRPFQDEDRPGTPYVVVVSARAAELLWPGEDPLGRRLRFPGTTPWLTVVGVAGNVTQVGDQRLTLREGPERRPSLWNIQLSVAEWPDLYLSGPQVGIGNRNDFLVRAAGDVDVVAASVREAIRDLDPEVAATTSTLEEEEYGSGRTLYALVGKVLAGFGLLTLALAAVGVHGVVAHTSVQRHREVGIRMALGAGRGAVVGLVVRETLVLAAVGVGLGLVVSLGLSRLAGGFIVGVPSYDPVTHLGAAAALLGLAVVASIVPTVRASRVDPVEVLRAE